MLSFNEQKQCGDWMAVEHSQPGQNVIEKAKSAMVLSGAKGHQSLDSSNQERYDSQKIKRSQILFQSWSSIILSTSTKTQL